METITLTKPKNNLQEILWHLITFDKVSLMDFHYMAGFRMRISELRRLNVDFESHLSQGKNRHGNTYNYSVHYLRNKNKAIEIYELLTSKNKKKYEFRATN